MSKSKLINFFSVLFVASTVILPAYAEIEKVARMCEPTLCLYWWPAVSPAQGWHQDIEASYSSSANMLIPDGSNFSQADTVMYAIAIYKQRMPETLSLEMFIADDKAEFLKSHPDLKITETVPVITKDGKKLRSFTFFPKTDGNWERVSYGEEGDFYLTFTISSRSNAGYNKDMPAYESMVRSYKE